MGLFVTFEGIEGSGKTTQIAHIRDWLKGDSHTVFVTREPGGSKVGDQIRRLLLVREYNIVPMAELFLYMAARAQHVEEVIMPALKKGIF